MSISFIKKCALACIILVGNQSMQAIFSSKSRNDYFPLYKTLDPHAYLYTRTKEQLHGRIKKEEDKLNKFCFCLTPFAQNANIGKDINNNDSELGSLNDRWSMIGLLMGPTPDGNTLVDSLATARAALFPTIAPSEVIDDEGYIDKNQEFGFFKFPATYRKRGLRCELTVGLTEDFGFFIQAGASDINFTVTDFTNLTTDSGSGCSKTLDKTTVNELLMCKLETIAKELGINLCNYHQAAMEDTHINLYWRHAFEVNKGKEDEWPRFLCIPHLAAGFSIASGKEKNPLDAFGLPFGNNGHNAAGFEGGVDIDFTETIAIGWYVGVTSFFENQFSDYPMPTSKLQSGIYPFKTNVVVRPGLNWHFGLKMNAHHFFDKLSCHFEWVILEHKNDTFCINNCGCEVFKPEVLECRSGWKAQLVNTALNYDISPNCSLGFLWQAPVSQRNVFRSSTVLFGLNMTF